ncbi:MAG: nitric oxide-sensing protein NosP [bacterium]
MSKPHVRKGSSRSLDPVVAARELSEAVADPEASLVVFYCSPMYDLHALGREIASRFRGIQVVGCTTAGEITPAGYLQGSLTGVSIGGPGLRAASGRIGSLADFKFARGAALGESLLNELSRTGAVPTGKTAFGFLLVDGLSMQEEALVSSLYRSLGDIPLFGGSAGDGTRFQQTYIYHDGAFHADSAVFTVVETDYPFLVFKTQHFVSGAEKMVVTEANPSQRVVTEINGEPAGREYARMVGLEVDKLTPMIFSAHPVVVTIGGETYVRSIQKVNEDESLTFFCAIEKGIVLTVARGVDLVENLEEAFQSVREQIGPPQLILGCDCILRNLEADQRGLLDKIGALMQANNVIGFATYGEQYNAMHVNQTFTGVAIGGA